MSDKDQKPKRIPTDDELGELRREVEFLELKARRKAALDAMRGERETRKADRVARKPKSE